MLKKNTIKINDILIGILGLFLVGFIIWAIYGGSYLIPKEFKEYGCFTIATTTGKGYKYRHGRVIYYEYTYRGKKYRDWSLWQDNVKSQGGKYLLKVNSKRPDVTLSYFSEGQIETMDSIKFSPCP